MLSANLFKISVNDKGRGAKHLVVQIFRTETSLDILNMGTICAQNDTFRP